MESNLLLSVYMDMCACSSVHGRRKIASDLLTFPPVRTENNTELKRMCADK